MPGCHLPVVVPTTRAGLAVPPSERDHVPAPLPVVTVNVAIVDETTVSVPAVTVVVPTMLFVIEAVDSSVQAVPLPTIVSVIGVETFGGIFDGDTFVMPAAPPARTST